MVEVDVRGLSCPLPVMQAKEAVKAGADAIVVLADSGTAKQNVVNMLSDAGYAVSVEQAGGEWTINATRA